MAQRQCARQSDPVRLVHFVGFRGERYWNAVRVFGLPDMIHEAWDRYAADEVAPGDLVVFAEGEYDRPPRSFTVEAEMKRRQRSKSGLWSQRDLRQGVGLALSMAMADSKPILHTHDCNGAKLAWWEWNPAARGETPTMLFAHATGFHARVWDAVIAHFPRRHVISLDLRGHGRSSGAPVDHWTVFAQDTAVLLDHLGIQGAMGIGHSMGGHTLLQVAADRPRGFERLVLFDPVVVEPGFYVASTTPWDSGEPHPTIKRKRDFASPDAMFERFADRDPYALFTPRVLRDYCEYGLLEQEGGGFALACAPEMEASVYMSSRSNGGILDAARTVEVPVVVVRAKRLEFHDFKSSPTWPELASILPHGRDIYRPDMTHFHPFQDPSDAAGIIAEAEAGA